MKKIKKILLTLLLTGLLSCSAYAMEGKPNNNKYENLKKFKTENLKEALKLPMSDFIKDPKKAKICLNAMLECKNNSLIKKEKQIEFNRKIYQFINTYIIFNILEEENKKSNYNQNLEDEFSELYGSGEGFKELFVKMLDENIINIIKVAAKHSKDDEEKILLESFFTSLKVILCVQNFGLEMLPLIMDDIKQKKYNLTKEEIEKIKKDALSRSFENISFLRDDKVIEDLKKFKNELENKICEDEKKEDSEKEDEKNETEKHQQNLNKKENTRTTLERFRKSELINILSNLEKTKYFIRCLNIIKKNKVSNMVPESLEFLIYNYMSISALCDKIRNSLEKNTSEEVIKDMLIKKLEDNEMFIEAIKLGLDKIELSKIMEKSMKNKDENVIDADEFIKNLKENPSLREFGEKLNNEIEEIKKLSEEEIKEKYGKNKEEESVENEEEELKNNQELEENIQIFEDYFSKKENKSKEEDEKEEDEKENSKQTKKSSKRQKYKERMQRKIEKNENKKEDLKKTKSKTICTPKSLNSKDSSESTIIETLTDPQLFEDNINLFKIVKESGFTRIGYEDFLDESIEKFEEMHNLYLNIEENIGKIYPNLNKDNIKKIAKSEFSKQIRKNTNFCSFIERLYDFLLKFKFKLK